MDIPMKKNRLLGFAAFLTAAVITFTYAPQVRAAFDLRSLFNNFGSGNAQTAPDAAFDSPAARLRTEMNSLLKEHTVMAGLYLTAMYGDVPADRLVQLMDANRNKIAAIVERNYNTETKDTFLQVWSQHMLEYGNYTRALKEKDTAAMTTARNNLKRISNDMGRLFDSVSNNMTTSEIEGLMNEHVNGTLSLVDAVSQGNATRSANLLKAGYDQAGRFADVMTRAMVMEKPDLYQ